MLYLALFWIFYVVSICKAEYDDLWDIVQNTIDNVPDFVRMGKELDEVASMKMKLEPNDIKCLVSLTNEDCSKWMNEMKCKFILVVNILYDFNLLTAPLYSACRVCGGGAYVVNKGSATYYHRFQIQIFLDHPGNHKK